MRTTVQGKKMPEKRRKIHDRIVEKLGELITEGKLSPGDRLPPERKLAELFQVSRNSVREAIKALGEKGIVVSRTGAGTFVADTDRNRIIDAMAGAFSEGRLRLGEVFELRRLLEPQVAALAARRIDPETIGELERIVKEQEAALADGIRHAALDDRFHRVIVRAAGNRVVASVFTKIQDLLQESRSESLQSLRRGRRSVATHQEIIGALKAGDGELAAEKMLDHLTYIEESLDID